MGLVRLRNRPVTLLLFACVVYYLVSCLVSQVHIGYDVETLKVSAKAMVAVESGGAAHEVTERLLWVVVLR